tara:strand:+ start:114 stop:728 length:615 start_codon:yes stop_codon:yes gene_type:complete
MLLKNYVFWSEALPISLCDQIVKYGTQQPSQEGKVGKSSKSPPKEIRDSTISFLEAPWILDWIREPLKQANVDIFRFDLNHLENLQFTKYVKGQHYSWHRDIQEENHQRNYGRKLSFIIPLTDSKNYEGGEVEFKSFNASPDGKIELYDASPDGKPNPPIISKDEFKEQGTLLIFSSIIWHRVKPVTKGIRYSLVGWWGGPLFR